MKRFEYMAYLKKNFRDESLLQELIALDKNEIKGYLQTRDCNTVSIYRNENMLFLYCEVNDIDPVKLFPNLTEYTELIPDKSTDLHWLPMCPVFYNSIPKEDADWIRSEKKVHRGKLAYLKDGYVTSYVYHHTAIVNEGLLDGDKRQFISLYNNILFQYFEEPKEFIHINSESKEKSKCIEAWEKVNPALHFDHEMSGKDNFKFMEELLSYGREDIGNEKTI